MSSSYTVSASGAASDINPRVNPGVVSYTAASAVVLLLLMLLGLALRLAQAEWLPMPPDLFYETMTAHGVGMVGIAGLAGAGIMWHFLSRYVRLSRGILVANLVLFLAGVAMILGAIFLVTRVCGSKRRSARPPCSPGGAGDEGGIAIPRQSRSAAADRQAGFHDGDRQGSRQERISPRDGAAQCRRHAASRLAHDRNPRAQPRGDRRELPPAAHRRSAATPGRLNSVI